MCVCVCVQVTDAAVKAFVEDRPGMTFVGLLATDAGFSPFLSGEGSLQVVLRSAALWTCLAVYYILTSVCLCVCR